MRTVPLIAALLCASLAACASAPLLRRGGGAEVILDELSRVLGSEGYACGYTPDKRLLNCEHPEWVDFRIGYVPQSNHLQVFSGFDRVRDDSLADVWRGDCQAVIARINEINAGYIPKITCEGEILFFTFYVWVPDTGLTDQDTKDLFSVLRAAVGDTIRASDMLKE